MSKVLLIDDSAVVRIKVGDILKEAGYLVLTASDGAEGLEIAKKERPDLIILDINMPEMNGWQVLRTLRITPKIFKIPVVMATTRNMMADIEKAFSLGAKDYVVKDEDLSELVRKVDKVLDRSGPPKGWAKRIFSDS